MPLRDANRDDFAPILEMNNAAVPAVNALSIDELTWLCEHAHYCRVDDAGDGITAFLIGFAEGSDYESVNYRWFADRYAAFAYVDRIVVHPARRRRGSARRLYADFFQQLAAKSGRATCEVNIRPPNPVSLAFHETLGFEQVGSQESEGGTKTVALLERAVPGTR